MFGWWVSIDGKRVASLEYRAWDVNSQFWHIYEVIELSKGFASIGLDPDRWCDPSVTIQNRFAIAFEEQGVIMLPKGENLIALRNLYVPENVLTQSEKTIDAQLHT